MRRGSTNQDILSAVSAVFNVELDDVLSKFPVKGLVYFIEDEVEEVEAGDARRWEINGASYRQVHVVFGSHPTGLAAARTDVRALRYQG